jgi:hypothetical protein
MNSGTVSLGRLVPMDRCIFHDGHDNLILGFEVGFHRFRLVNSNAC